MRLQLTFLLPDIDTANQASQALLLAHVNTNNIRFLAKPGTNLGKLQATNAFENSQVTNEHRKSVLIGALVGLVIGLYAYFFQQWIAESMYIHGLVFVGMLMILGIAIAIIRIIYSLTGEINVDLRKYKSRIDKGAVLMIVSAPFQRSMEINRIVDKSYIRF